MTGPGSRRLLTRASDFFRELKRRKVYQVTAIYVVLAVGGLELLDLLIPSTRLPQWASPLLLGLAIVGLPVVLVLAWTFDVTPSGVVRTADAADVRDTDDGGGIGRRDAAASGLGMTSGPPDSVETATGSPADIDATDELDPLSVAVLPFDNLSGSDEAQPFVVGLHDDLLTELSRASALTVISRTSVRSYGGTNSSLRQIGRELGVGTIVEGGVQKAGDRVRLNIQVIDARTDAHLWAERYDRELTAETIFDLQSELASSIMAAVEARLTRAEQARSHDRPTDDLEAYRLHALGRDAFVDRSEEGMRLAVRHFGAAIERDGEYALAWAGLGMALVGLVDYGHADSRELVERGRVACLKALELDPELPEAHAAKGNLHAFLRQGAAARASLSEAMRLGPGLALGHQWASWVDLLLGDPDRAAAAALRATRLAPLDPEARGNLAMAFMARGELERSVAEARRSLEPHPGFGYSRWVLGLALHGLGRHGEARGELLTLGLDGHGAWTLLAPWATVSEGLCAAIENDDASVQAAIKQLETVPARVEAAILRAALGDLDRGFEDLRAVHRLSWDDALCLRYFSAEPMELLRGDPRYADVIATLDRSWGV